MFEALFEKYEKRFLAIDKERKDQAAAQLAELVRIRKALEAIVYRLKAEDEVKGFGLGAWPKEE